ncbi:hypothetical protein ZTR_07763 [Talaromyces verruculosus]|nr:hypothetical protein ZTR_07763 [Talaromyces verruculosus]
MTFDVDAVLAKLKQNDKITLLSGTDFWHTHPIPEHNIPSIRVTDGPNGIRGTKFFAGVPAACMPCGTALGATWDSSLLRQAGNLIGQECLAKGAHCWLGPTVNMQRSPLGGRGFESFAEDPHLSGKLAAAMIAGCEQDGSGVISTVKHFVGNDQEHERRAVDCLITPRALREVYLRPFQIVARDAKPGALMTSYNKINGKHVADNWELLEGIVRKEWQWQPLIMSDWYGTYTTIDAMVAGLDLEMPGVSRYRGKYIDSAVQARLIKQSIIDTRSRNVLKFVKRASQAKVSPVEKGRDYPEDRKLNRTLCSNSIVLLKNEENILPLPKTIRKIALIGSHMKHPQICGGGSAALLPYYSVSLYDAITEVLPKDAEITYEVGAYAHNMLPVIDRMLSSATMHFYNEPPTITDRKLLGTEHVTSTAFQLMDYNEIPELNRALFWASLVGDFTPDVSGTWDFGLSVFGTANLYIDDELVIDNTSEQTRGTSFFGKGTVQETGSKELVKDQKYKLRIEFGSANTTTMETIGMVNFGGGAAHLGACLRMDAKQMIEDAVQAAATSDYTIVCTGLSGEWESEGFDRPHMDLPPGVGEMINRVLVATQGRAIIVNQSGTPVTMPWANEASCIVQAWYGGNETGHGIADVLFGDVNPCAKLPLSWPVHVSHNPAYLSFASVGGRVLYSEDVYVGYKFYEATGREVLFPFGHGLSYTTFELTSPTITITPETFEPEKPSIVELCLKNTGHQAGAQILQLYVSAPNSPTPRPIKELHGFEKVFLEPGQQKTVSITVDKYATSFWDEIESMWKSEEGDYEVLVGTSSVDILGKAVLRFVPDRLLPAPPEVQSDELVLTALEPSAKWPTWKCYIHFSDRERFESLGERILVAVERQQKVLDELVAQRTDRGPTPFITETRDLDSSLDDVDLEIISRNDTPKTPITGSDMILSWPIFPRNKPVHTFPAYAYSEKEKNIDPHRQQTMLPSMIGYDGSQRRRILELRDIYMSKIQIKNPIVDACELDEHLTKVLEKGFDWSASSCLVLLVLSLAAIWGDYPHNDRRTKVDCIVSYEGLKQTEFVTNSVPEHRMRESLGYFSMARERMSTAQLDDSLLGVACFCLFGMWYQYNIEPIPGWKMFRTASMLWEAYNLKHRDGTTERSKQEQSLEQRLYWTCLKSECEVRYELTNLPSSSSGHEQSIEDSPSYYYYLAEISLRRLLNRARNAVVILNPDVDSATASILAETLCKLNYQLEQWLEYLPPVLRFNRPLECLPPPNEPELVKLVRERYVEVRELLCRAHLYLCLHCGTTLSREQTRLYGAKASEGAKVTGVCSAEYVVVPPAWADSVRRVIERLEVWSEEGGGIRELAKLLRWLMEDVA